MNPDTGQVCPSPRVNVCEICMMTDSNVIDQGQTAADYNWIPKREPFGIAKVGFLQAGCPSCHSTMSRHRLQ